MGSLQIIPYIDVIIGTMASQITSLTIVYLGVYSGADQRKHQSTASLAFVRGIYRWPVNSPHKVPATRKMFLFDDVIMKSTNTRLNKEQWYVWLHGCSTNNHNNNSRNRVIYVCFDCMEHSKWHVISENLEVPFEWRHLVTSYYHWQEQHWRKFVKMFSIALAGRIHMRPAHEGLSIASYSQVFHLLASICSDPNMDQ